MSDKLIIKKRRGQDIQAEGIEVLVDFQTQTVLDLKNAIQKKTRIETLRQWLTFDDLKTILDDNKKPLSLLNLKSGQTLIVKDLGPQLQWIVVFYSEYIGPILVFALMYLLGKRQDYVHMQNWALWMVVGHYVKRILETKFVHIFSRDSMPTRRALINCLHYWVLCGLFIGLELYHFRSFSEIPQWRNIFIVTFAICEFMNLMCHITLKNLRSQPAKQGEYVALHKQRSIPYGYGFNQISSANYFWEVMSWTSFSLFTGSFAAWAFTLFSGGQMLIWAKEKHRRYLKEFGDKYPRQRKAMFPFLI